MLDGFAIEVPISPELVGVVGRSSRDGSEGNTEEMIFPEPTPNPLILLHNQREAGTKWCRGPATRSTGLGRAGDTTATRAAGSLPPDHFPPVGSHSELLGQPVSETANIGRHLNADRGRGPAIFVARTLQPALENERT